MRFIQSASLDAVGALLRNTAIPVHDVIRSTVSFARQDIQVAKDKEEQTTSPGDTPGLGNFLWGLWDEVLDIAEEKASSQDHDRLLEFVKQLREQGGDEGWRVWGGAASWAKLSLLGPVVRESFNGPHGVEYLDCSSELAQNVLSGDTPDVSDEASLAFSEARRRWLNLNQFISRLWNDANVNFDVYGIWAMRSGLEDDPRPSPSETQDLALEAAARWMEHAGEKMYRCREIYGPKGDPNWHPDHGVPGRGGARWDGVDGYDPSRWALWKEIFNEVANEEGRRTNVTIAAKAGVRAMERVENAG